MLALTTRLITTFNTDTMDTNHWHELQTNEVVRKRLAKVMARECLLCPQ
jgi:hypothetical protein